MGKTDNEAPDVHSRAARRVAKGKESRPRIVVNSNSYLEIRCEN